MADFCLPDAVDTTETLFKAVRVPRQIVIDHQVGALQVDTLTSGVGSDEDTHFFILLKQFLDLAPLVTEHTSVNGYNCFVIAKERPNFISQVTQGIAVLCKDN